MRAPAKQAAEELREELGTLAFAAQAFPMLTSWGVEDFSHTIHSLGCNYLAALGRELGYWSISDYPVRVKRPGKAHSVRPDVVWWNKETEQVVVLGEFERAAPGKPEKLADKARNLLEAHHALGEQPRVLLLLGWTISGANLGDLSSVRAVMHRGSRPRGGVPVPALGHDSAFLLATAVFGDVDGSRRLLRIVS